MTQEGPSLSYHLLSLSRKGSVARTAFFTEEKLLLTIISGPSHATDWLAGIT